MQPNLPDSTPRQGRSVWKRRWHHLYFALAGFDIVVIIVSITLSHNNMNKYSEVVAYAEGKMRVLTHIGQLSNLAQKVNAPGNDVFDSKDSQTEQGRFDTARKEFDQSLAHLSAKYRASEGSNVQLLEDDFLKEISTNMDQMQAVATEIFFHFENNEADKAAEHMAEMDRRYATLNNAIERLRTVQTEAISQTLNNHKDNLLFTRDVEIYFGILIIFAVASISIFGNYLTRFVKQSMAEAERNHAILAAVSKAAIIAFTDKKGRIVEVNERFVEISGYTRDELIGQNHRIINSGAHPKAFFADIWRTISAGKYWSGDIHNRKKNGDDYFVRSVITPIKGGDGEIEQYMAIRFDITEEKKISSDLLAAQIAAKIGSWRFDLRTGTLIWSAELYRMFEVSESTDSGVLRDIYQNHVHPDDWAELNRKIQLASTTGENYIFTHRIILDGGARIKFVQAVGNVTTDRDGKPIVLFGTCQDITELVRVQEESRFILDALKIGIWKYNPTTQSLYWDQNMYNLYGIKEGDFAGTYEAWASTLTPESKAEAEKRTAQALRGDRDVDTVFEVDTPAYGKRHISSRGKVLRDHAGHPTMMYGINMDVTAEVQAKEKFGESQVLLATVLDALPLAVSGKDIKNDFQWNIWNKAAENLFGIKAKDCLGKYDRDYFPQKQAELFRQKDIATSQSLRDITIDEEQLSLQKGDVILRTLKTVAHDKSGEPTVIISITEDITEAKQRDKAIRASLLKLETAEMSAKMGNWEFDLAKQQRYWSKGCSEIFGYPAKQAVPGYAEFIELVHPDDREQLAQTFKKAESQGLDKFENKFRIVIHGGKTTRWIHEIGSVELEADGRPRKFSGTVRDITAEVQMNMQLVQTSKLASLGEMSAGIAHEINNPLAIISGSVTLLAKFIDNPEKHAAKVELIQKSCDRIARIVSGLKKFSRSGEKVSFKPHILANISKEAVFLTESNARRYDAAVSIECSTQAEIMCDDVEIEQVLVNLINNAVDAVKSSHEKWIKIIMLEESEEVVLRVIDSGPGIPESLRNKLFNPFFTTKKVGEGTGLGLSITKGILDEHKGSITVVIDSPNTCFELRFPMAKAIQNAA